MDIGILRQLAGYSGEASGEVYETYVVAEAFKWIKTNRKNIEIYFYRTRSGLELDLILKTDKGFIGIEIKSSQKVTMSDCRSMLAVAGNLKGSFRGGICIYRGAKIEKISDPDIWAIPSRYLFSSI